MNVRFCIGTRGSALAMAQANLVEHALVRHNPGMQIDIRIIKTKGDRVQNKPLHEVGGAGLFTRELEKALLDEKIDVAVHSLKDLPATMRPGLSLAAVPQREDPRDVLISASGKKLADLPQGACVATGALRRRVQLLKLRPDLKLVDMRGNLDTRLRKVRELPELDATMLAAAGLSRMGWLDRVTEFFDTETFIPSGGQAAIGLQIREGDYEAEQLVAPLNHTATRTRVDAERAFLAVLEAGCQIPVAVHARLDGDQLTVDGMFAGVEGDPLYQDRVSGPAEDAVALGEALAHRILDAGGRELRLTFQ